MMHQQRSIQRQYYSNALYLLALVLTTQKVIITPTFAAETTTTTTTTTTRNSLELINRELAKLPIPNNDGTSTTSLDLVTKNNDRNLQSTGNAICTSIQSIVFQNLVSCDCDIAPFDGLLDVACSQSNLCSPSNILCGTVGFNVKFALFDAGNLTVNLCVSDIKLSLLSQTFGPFCIDYNVQVLRTNLRTLCPNGIISCLLGNFGGGGGGGGNSGTGNAGTGGGGGGGGGMATMGTDGGMTMGGGMGMGRHRMLLMGGRSISASSVSSSLVASTNVTATTTSRTSRRHRRVQTTTKTVRTSLIGGCNVYVGDAACNYCAPCDNRGGIKFDCSNAVPGLIQIDTCAKFRAWTSIGTTIKPRLPDLDIPLIVASSSLAPSTTPSSVPTTFE